MRRVNRNTAFCNSVKVETTNFRFNPRPFAPKYPHYLQTHYRKIFMAWYQETSERLGQKLHSMSTSENQSPHQNSCDSRRNPSKKIRPHQHRLGRAFAVIERSNTPTYHCGSFHQMAGSNPIIGYFNNTNSEISHRAIDRSLRHAQ